MADNNDAYRTRAAELVNAGKAKVRVPDHALVAPVRDEGAFVELVVWVPASAINAGNGDAEP